jgi:ABC-type polysaccharide/polyol phosphate transport system ATPase subunit
MIDIRLAEVSKRYRIQNDFEQPGHPLARKLRRMLRRPSEFWAVRDVSFEVARGEALGIIGHNGAGKSTMLKLLSSITTPTAGEIEIHGRLSALIEVGSGFHPELTGRENVFLNGSILGMRRAEIARKLDRIVEFAGVEQFVDTPVKRFSTGMYVRLGFSIAAHLEPDILLLDEVLAVGDAAFQERCLKRIDEMRRDGTTIIFISHDLAAVERLCRRVILMDHGQIAAEGPAGEVIARYEAGARGPAPTRPGSGAQGGFRHEASITSCSLEHPSGAAHGGFTTGSPLVARIGYEVREHVPDAAVEVFFLSQDGEIHCQLSTELNGSRIELWPGRGEVEFTWPELGLLPGPYRVSASLKHRGGAPGADIDHHPACGVLRVDPGKSVRGAFYAPHRWRVSAPTPAPEPALSGR